MKGARNSVNAEIGVLTSLPLEYGMGFTVLDEPKPRGATWVVSVLGRANQETLAQFDIKPKPGEQFVVVSSAHPEKGWFSHRIVRTHWLEESAEEIEAGIERNLGRATEP